MLRYDGVWQGGLVEVMSAATRQLGRDLSSRRDRVIHTSIDCSDSARKLLRYRLSLWVRGVVVVTSRGLRCSKPIS